MSWQVISQFLSRCHPCHDNSHYVCQGEYTPRQDEHKHLGRGYLDCSLCWIIQHCAYVVWIRQLQIYPTRKDPYVHLVISPGLLSKGPCGPELNRPCTRARCVVAGPSGVTGGIAQSSEHQCRKASWKVVSGVPPKRLSAG